ncbi:MAG: hypothetical protein LBU85_03620 [Treponema sp.]|jgi:hypothetical protein|nr:hypothetical protein [Treponema sp.]
MKDDSFKQFLSKTNLIFKRLKEKKNRNLLLMWLLINILIIITIALLFINANKHYQQDIETSMNKIYLMEEQINKLEEQINLMALTEEYNEKIKFEHEEQTRAIEMVKNTRNPDTGKTYGEEAQSDIAKGAKKNINYKWVAKKDEQFGTYLVSFVDSIEERGKFWDVNFSTDIVRSVSDNWQLSTLYGLTSLRNDKSFTIVEIISEEVTATQNRYNFNDESGIVYKIVATVRNNTNKDITSCSFGANLVVIYNDQKIIERNANRVFFSRASVSDPWRSNRSKEITIYTKSYDYFYKNYNPSKAVCYISIYAEDPLGYEYNGAFAERNIKKLFEKLD